MATETNQPELVLAYESALLDYCQTHGEEALYRASEVSMRLIADGTYGPDEIVALHYDAVQSITSADELSAADRIRILNDAHQFLLEVMIGYGAHYKEFLDLRLEIAETRAESAERSEREKLEVLSIIAHELGNPLTVAIGNMRLASRFMEVDDLARMRPLLIESRDALDRLAALTRQINAASRGEAPDLTLEPTDLVDVARRAAAWMKTAAAEKGVAFVERFPEQEVCIAGSDDELISIITNLLSNALRYTPAGGSITIALWAEQGRARVRVSDTGIGIDLTEQQRIFDKFYRSAQARELVSSGLGMGLHIVRRQVEAHGGTVSIDSMSGVGSQFTIEIPLMNERVEG